eukprot:gene9329-11442_t
MEQLAELVPFLQDPKAEIKILALQHLLSVSDSQEARDILKKTPIVNNLIKLIGDNNLIIDRHALTILINLCQDSDLLAEITKKNIVPRLVDGSTNSKNKLSEIYSMLLSNVTHTKEGCLQLMQSGKELEGFFIMKLIDFLTLESDKPDYMKSPKNNWIINTVLNVTQIQEGRKIVLDKNNNVLAPVLNLARHEDIIKRRGILGIIRNCCYSEIHHDYILNDIGILSTLILPIRGSDQLTDDEMNGLDIIYHNKSIPSDNKRESDLECRKMLIDSLVFLTGTKKARVFMRDSKVYPIIRNYYNSESDEYIRDNIEKVVEILLRDEEPDGVQSSQEKKISELEDEDAPFDVEEI